MARLGRIPSFPDDSFDDARSDTWEIPTDLDEAALDECGSQRDFSMRCPECDAELFVSRLGRSLPPQSGVRSLSYEVYWETPVERAVRYATSVSETVPLSALPELFLRTMARVLVVVDERRRPLGVVTPTHVLRAVGEQSPEQLTATTALDISTSGGAFLPEKSTLRTAARRLSIEDREYIVVITEDGRLAGLITPGDVISALVDEAEIR